MRKYSEKIFIFEGEVPEWSTNVKGFRKGQKLPQNIWGNLGSLLFSNE